MAKRKRKQTPQPQNNHPRRRLLLIISLVISLFVTGGALAQWSGLFSQTKQAGKKNLNVQVEPQSFNAGSPSKEYIYAGGRLIATEEPGGCTYTGIPSAPIDFAAAGNTGSFFVTASASTCMWTAVSNAVWITITLGSSNTGSAWVQYTVQQNTSTASRTGTLTVAGQTVTINQAGTASCTVSLNPTSQMFTSAGGTGTIQLTAAAGCAWTASSEVGWVTITPPLSGSGNATISYTVAANPDATQRNGVLHIGGQTFTVQQSGTTCVATLSPTAATLPLSGGTGSFMVNIASNCSWTAIANDSWITITGGSSGTGNGQVSFSVGSTGSDRSGTITAAGLTFTITQSNGCNYFTSPGVFNVSAAAGNGTITITVANGCPWNASASSIGGWLALTSPSSGSGNGSVTFSYSQNTSGQFRTGNIRITGTTPIQVKQSPSGGGTGSGNGLLGEYFNFTNLQDSMPACGSLVYSRTDATINNNWGTGGPDNPSYTGVNADRFYTRWTGQVEAPFTETYTFTVRADDGVRLWVNNQLLINGWRPQAPTTYVSNAIPLTASQRYDIRLDYFELTGGAEIYLWWQSQSISDLQIVPQSRLFPATLSQPLYEGRFESANCTTLTGWALNRRTLSSAIAVDVYADNSSTPLVTNHFASITRTDIPNFSNDNCGFTAHGFSIQTPSQLLDGNQHLVQIKYAGTNIQLNGSPILLTCGGGGGAPPAPTNLTATAVAQNQIALAWQFGGTTANGFRIQRSVNGGSYADYATVNGQQVTTFSDVNVAPGNSYCYKVAAFNNSGDSAYIGPQCVTIQGGGGSGIPDPPTNVQATFVPSPRKVDLTWTHNGQNTVYYQVLRRYRLPGGTKWTTYASLTRQVYPPQTSFSDLNRLDAGYTYQYQVIAFNGNNQQSAAGETMIQIPSNSPYSCVSVSAFSGTGGAGGYGYTEGPGGGGRWRSPSAGAVGLDPVSGLQALFIADTENHVIRMLYLEGPAKGNSILLAGSGVAGYSEGNDDPYQAMFNYPQGLAVQKNLSGVVTAIIVADTDNQCLRRLLPPLGGSKWRVGLLAGQPGKADYLDGVPFSSGFKSPRGLAISRDGSIYVADTDNQAVRLLTSDGYASTWYRDPNASLLPPTINFQPVGLALNPQTDELYVSDQWHHLIGSLSGGSFVTLAGSGSAGFNDGTGTTAAFNTPQHLAWFENDIGEASLYIADRNNHRLRVFNIIKGTVTTLAGSGTAGYVNFNCAASQFNQPSGVAVGFTQELYVVDKGNNSIRRVQ